MGCCVTNNIFNFDNIRYYTLEVSDKYKVIANDIVLCTRDITQTRNQLGLPAIIPSFCKEKIICGTNLYKVENLQIVSNNYLYLIFNSETFRKHMLEQATGSTILMLTKESVLDYYAIVPEIDNFEKINSDIDSIFEKINLLLHNNLKLQELKEIYMKKFFD